MQKPVRVKILNQEYLIRSDNDEAQIQRVAQFVNERFNDIKDSTKGLSERKIAILAAFDIASEYLQQKMDRESLEKDIQERVRTLSFQIDNCLE